MAINLPGPYEMDYEYIVSNLTHHMRVNCIAVGAPVPGSTFASILLQTKGGGTVDALTATGNFWSFIRPLVSTTVTVAQVTLWKYLPGTFEKTFIAAREANLLAGTNVSTPRLAGEFTESFRSANGGMMYIRIEEHAENVGVFQRASLIANAGGSGTQQLAAYVVSSAGWMIARDDSFPVAPYSLLLGQNEAVFKKRYRNA